MLKSALTSLNQRECEILTKRKLIDDPLTLEELSNEYNVSRERIRQIEAKALRKLRHPSRSSHLKNFLDE